MRTYQKKMKNKCLEEKYTSSVPKLLLHLVNEIYIQMQ